MSLGKAEAIVIMIGLIVLAAGIIVLLPSNPVEYNTDVEIEPGSFLFRGSLDGIDDTQIHSIRVLENATSMHVVLKCGDNDFDLYGGFGYTPTTDDYEFRGFESGGEDFIYEYLEEGIWHLMVHSYSGSGQYELRINIDY
ncbi:MAG: hypothetical protein RTS72_04795 [Candidatus Thorarchaeota archaeon]